MVGFHVLKRPKIKGKNEAAKTGAGWLKTVFGSPYLAILDARPREVSIHINGPHNGAGGGALVHHSSGSFALALDRCGLRILKVRLDSPERSGSTLLVVAIVNRGAPSWIASVM